MPQDFWTCFNCIHIEAIPGKKQTPESIINAAIFPAGSKPDDSPLFVLCVNDTCSFTWTGDEHINQVSSAFFGHIAVWRCPSNEVSRGLMNIGYEFCFFKLVSQKPVQY